MDERADQRRLHGSVGRIDPDPLMTLLTIAGTLAGILAPVAWDRWNAPARVRSRIVTTSRRLRDDLRRMEADLEILQDVVVEAGAAHLPFEIGNRMELTEDQFVRYREATNNLMTYATRCVKKVN